MAVTSFDPIPALRVAKHDVTLLFLTSRAWHQVPVHDPWFRATSHVHQTGVRYGRFWASDRASSVLGCTEQYEICNTTYCAGPNIFNAFDGRATYGGLVLDTEQKALYAILVGAAKDVLLRQTVDRFGSAALLADDSLTGPFGRAPPLANDHWRAEVAHLAAGALATLQRLVVDFVAPLDFPVPTAAQNGSNSSSSSTTLRSTAFVRPARPELGGAVCGAVRVRDPRFPSFSVAGVAAVVALGAAVTVVNVACVPGGVFIARRWWGRRRAAAGGGGGGAGFAEREWRAGGLLRLQRTALAKHGVRWEAVHDGGDGDDDVPVAADAGLAFSAERLWTVERPARKSASVESWADRRVAASPPLRPRYDSKLAEKAA